MDERDERILELLMENSRIPITEVARELGVTETAVRKRIKRLESCGAIRSYSTIVDPFSLGYSGVALVGIDTAPETLLSTLKYVKSLKGVRYASLTTGDHMIMFEVWCKTTHELEAFLKKLEKKEGVMRVCPAIVLKRTE